ncbi:hypothetical protein [Streptomonospora salina]|uniref:Uncharacterized protein n=1 Tax=Streptomonospora salina TaxID=104205 RepID=A0A841ECN0_9ACTN|nr:hypothetical protein [Streptomonospora salina]MBB6000154.1 hypothetical protein [Streptomonospora salina]
MLEDWLRALIADYGHQSTTKLQNGIGQPEAAIRGPVEGFLTNIGQATGLEVVVHDEAHKAQTGARPHFAVRVAGAITGHVELKNPNENLDPARFKGHNKKQWERLKDLPTSTPTAPSGGCTGTGTCRPASSSTATSTPPAPAGAAATWPPTPSGDKKTPAPHVILIASGAR